MWRLARHYKTYSINIELALITYKNLKTPFVLPSPANAHKAALPLFSTAAKQHSIFFRSSQAASPRFLIASFSANSLLKPFLISLPILFPFFPQAYSIFFARLFPFFHKPISPLFPKPISLLLSYCKPFPKPIPDHLAHPPFDTPFSHYKVKYFISHTQMFLNLFSSFIKLFLQVVIDNKSAHEFWGQLDSPRTGRQLLTNINGTMVRWCVA